MVKLPECKQLLIIIGVP